MNIQLKTVFGGLIFEGDFSCIADAVKAALAAGAPGVILSRKYSEMKLENLSAAGDALHGLQISYNALGEDDLAVAAARSFLKSHADSDVAPEVQYQIAEHYLNLHDYPQAEKEFDLLKSQFGSSARATNLLSLLEVKGLIHKPDGSNRWEIHFDEIEACLRAVAGGVPSAHVIDGRVEHCVLLELLTDQGAGTKVVMG